MSQSTMTIYRTIAFFTCFFLLIGCESDKTEVPQPKNLNEAIAYITKEWTINKRYSFKNKSEDEAVSNEHFGTGLWIRNNWVYGKRDTALTNYFYRLGVNHPDGISSIILTSLHRTLNKKDIRLRQQITSYQKSWAEMADCEKKLQYLADSFYKRFKVGDVITVVMPVDTNYGNNSAGSILNCPKIKWRFNNKKDLLFKGEIIKKYYINSPSNTFFTVKLTSLNRSNINIMGDSAKIGNVTKLPLKGLAIQ